MGRIIIILVIIALGAAAWFLLTQGGNYNLPIINPGQQVSKPTTLPKQVEVSLNTQNGSDELGSATLQKVNGSLLVTVNLKGGPDGASQPAQIKQGSCGSPNGAAVKYQ